MKPAVVVLLWSVCFAVTASAESSRREFLFHCAAMTGFVGHKVEFPTPELGLEDISLEVAKLAGDRSAYERFRWTAWAQIQEQLKTARVQLETQIPVLVTIQVEPQRLLTIDVTFEVTRAEGLIKTSRGEEIPVQKITVSDSSLRFRD